MGCLHCSLLRTRHSRTSSQSTSKAHPCTHMTGFFGGPAVNSGAAIRDDCDHHGDLDADHYSADCVGRDPR